MTATACADTQLFVRQTQLKAAAEQLIEVALLLPFAAVDHELDMELVALRDLAGKMHDRLTRAAAGGVQP